MLKNFLMNYYYFNENNMIAKGLSFQDYMAEHNLLYILELDGNASPDDLNAVSHWT